MNSMRLIRWPVGILLLAITTIPLIAQSSPACANSTKVSCLIPNLYGPNGFILPNPFHSAHFTNAFQQSFTPLTNAIASQLTLLQNASPASGFTYTFDRSTGIYNRSAQSFGPTMSERAETIGKGRFFTAFTYQNFRFNKVDGIDIHAIPAVFKHIRELNADYEADFVTTNNDINLRIKQFTALGTVGLTDWLDASIAIPIVDLSLDVTSSATIHRIAPPHPEFCPPTVPSCTGQAHYFDQQNQNNSLSQVFTGSDSASGIGDITFRLKGTAFRRGPIAVALAADIRVPTGDEKDLLGAGTVGIKPFLVISRRGKFAPHVNLGYGANGDSILSGDISAGVKRHLPNQFFYSLGADYGVHRQLTLAVDLLGQRVFGAQRAFLTKFTADAPELANPAAGRQTYDDIQLDKDSFTITSGSVGAKWNLVNRLLLTANLLFRLNEGGLRTKLSPLIGVSYAF